MDTVVLSFCTNDRLLNYYSSSSSSSSIETYPTMTDVQYENDQRELATHEQHAWQVRCDECINSARSADKNRFAVKDRRRQ